MIWKHGLLYVNIDPTANELGSNRLVIDREMKNFGPRIKS